MHEHEGESDEDCEVYFLKPVNEYNIVDKIKEANRELFGRETDIDADGDGEADNAGANRKVTFAPNLEDYAPESTAGNCKPQTGNDGGEIEVNVEQIQLNAGNKFTVIAEEPQLETEHEAQAPPEICALPTTHQEANAEQSTAMRASNDDDDMVLEEICEEITVMDMQERPAALPQMRRMLKQDTFDCDDEQQTAPAPDEVDEENDNKSMSNLLISDIEDEEEQRSEPEQEDDDDEDDQLSIIVASYLPNDYENNYSFSSDADTGSVRLQPNNPGANSHKATKSRRMLPFCRRFSLRRKPSGNNNNGSARQQRPTPPREVTDLKLNYKICCEYRHASLEKLPKYTGYMSEYGLSREQRAQREEHAKRKQGFALQQTLKASEQEMQKMQDNERAFTTWLRNKMRFPINKTRNMFDVKVGSSGNTDAVGGASRKRNGCSGKNKK